MHPDRPSDPPLQRGTLAGRRVSWVDVGPRSASAVVMVHGMPGSHRDFRWLAPPLEQAGLRVIRLDMPGFGESEAISPRVSALAEHLIARVEALELDAALLLGHSFGGPPSLLAASRAPAPQGPIAGLALISSVGLRMHRSLRRFRGRRAINRGLHTPGLRRALTAGLHRMFVSGGFSPRTSAGEVRRTVDVLASFEFHQLDNALAALELPTFVAYSEDDAFIEAEISEELGAALPPGPRLRFATGGHNPQKHQACEIAEALIPFARSCLPDAPARAPSSPIEPSRTLAPGHD